MTADAKHDQVKVSHTYIPQLDYAISFAQIHELKLDRTSMKQGNLMVHTSVLHYSQTLQLEMVQMEA